MKIMEEVFPCQFSNTNSVSIQVILLSAAYHSLNSLNRVTCTSNCIFNCVMLKTKRKRVRLRQFLYSSEYLAKGAKLRFYS